MKAVLAITPVPEMAGPAGGPAAACARGAARRPRAARAVLRRYPRRARRLDPRPKPSTCSSRRSRGAPSPGGARRGRRGVSRGARVPPTRDNIGSCDLRVASRRHSRPRSGVLHEQRRRARRDPPPRRRRGVRRARAHRASGPARPCATGGRARREQNIRPGRGDARPGTLRVGPPRGRRRGDRTPRTRAATTGGRGPQRHDLLLRRNWGASERLLRDLLGRTARSIRARASALRLGSVPAGSSR